MTSVATTPPSEPRRWLPHGSRHAALLDRFETELRLGRLSSQSSGDRRLVTSKTVALLRALIGETRWKHPAQLLGVLRSLGRELHSVGGFREPAIGNVVRRVMAAVREEVQQQQLLQQQGNPENVGRNTSTTSTAPSQSSVLQSMLWSHPQQPKPVSSRTRHDSFDDEPTQQQILPAIFYTPRPDLKQAVMEAITEIMTDLEDTHKNINEQALSHIHADEVVLTYGASKTIELVRKQVCCLCVYVNMIVLGGNDNPRERERELAVPNPLLNLPNCCIPITHTYIPIESSPLGLSLMIILKFLKAAAAKKRSFQVVICEAAPHNGGHTMAASLAAAGIDTIVIHDSATFGLMARVNKVLLSAHTVLANGGLIAASGSNTVALAAQHNAVPVVAITGLFKLCPVFPHHGQDTLNDLVSPHAVLPYDELLQYNNNGGGEGSLELINPMHDYIPPGLLNLYVTNAGTFQPSYIYRLLAEYYHPDDWESFE